MSLNDKDKASIACATCKRPIPARLASRCMACGTPTCDRCAIAGLCKDDIERIWTHAGEQLVVIDRDMKHARHVSFASAIAAIGAIYLMIIPLAINDPAFSWILEGANIFLYLLIMLMPAALFIIIQYHFFGNFKKAIHARDDVLRNSSIELKYQPRNGFPLRSGKRFMYTCAACHGPVHVHHATCAICRVALCPKCVTEGLCPAHAAALSNDEKEQAVKGGDFPLINVPYMILVVFVVILFMALNEAFDLPNIIMIIPIMLLFAVCLKLFWTMHARQKLLNKYKEITARMKQA